MRELQWALLFPIYAYSRSCKSTQEIWLRLKAKFQGTKRAKQSSTTQLLFYLSYFKLKENESIDLAFNIFDDKVYQMEKYKLEKSSLEQNIMFIQGLRKEWKW